MTNATVGSRVTSDIQNMETEHETAGDHVITGNQGDDGASISSQIGDRHISSIPSPKYHVGQLVYAADQDGLMYESTVRKKVFGVCYQNQVVVGLASPSDGDETDNPDKKNEPSWHYFVHYHGWSVKWDRWTPESKLFIKSASSQQLAVKLLAEHKALKLECYGKRKGHKTKGTMSGSEFLMAWRLRLMRVLEDFENGSSTTSEPSQPESSENPSANKVGVKKIKKSENNGASVSKIAMDSELSCRKDGLTRLWTHSDKIALPSTLKKLLVDSWEIIAQCKSVPDLPAGVTIKDALDKYLHSKGVDTVSDVKETSDSPGCDKNDDAQAWIDMRDGICQCFDEALPRRLLYAEELPQLLTMDCATDVGVEKTYAEIYGCEHLLRLFTKLPEMLLGSMSEAEARPIFAKINDFLRFLHKDSSLFSLNYRPYNEVELRHKQKVDKLAEKKRKRQSNTDIVDCE